MSLNLPRAVIYSDGVSQHMGEKEKELVKREATASEYSKHQTVWFLSRSYIQITFTGRVSCHEANAYFIIYSQQSLARTKNLLFLMKRYCMMNVCGSDAENIHHLIFLHLKMIFVIIVKPLNIFTHQ